MGGGGALVCFRVLQQGPIRSSFKVGSTHFRATSRGTKRFAEGAGGGKELSREGGSARREAWVSGHGVSTTVGSSAASLSGGSFLGLSLQHSERGASF